MTAARCVEESKRKSKTACAAAHAAAQMIPGVARFGDLEPTQTPQRHANLVGQGADNGGRRSDVLEGQNRNRGALKHGCQNERRPCRLRTCALTSPQGRRRAFTEAA